MRAFADEGQAIAPLLSQIRARIASGHGVHPLGVLTHPAAAQGSLDQLLGVSFGPTETVQAHWNSPTGPLLGSTTSGLGSFYGASTITFTVPISPFGTYRVYGIGLTSHAGVVATLQLTPMLSLLPTSGHAGTTSSVSGTGFGSGEGVHVFFACASSPCAGTPLGTTTATSSGYFSDLVVTIPPTATLGSHPQGAVGANSGAFATTPFTVN